MASEVAKTISTCAIWLAMAMVLTFGLFRMNGSTLFFAIITLIIAGAAFGATVAVWYQPPRLAPQLGDERVRTDSRIPAPQEHGITRRPGV